MANLNFSTDYMDSLGPLGAMWLGEQFRTDQNTANINQDNTLESIAKSQQDRDIAKQKLPFELGQLEHQQKMNPLLLEQQGTKNKSDLAKLDKDKFDNFFGEFRNVIPQLQGTPADGALLADVARKHGMDPADPRIRRMIETASSGNAKAVNDMLVKIANMQEKAIQERSKIDYDAKVKSDPANVSADTRYRTDAEKDWRAEDRRVKLQVAELKASQAEAAKKNKNYAQAYTDYRAAAEAAYQAGNSEAGARLNQLATEMLEADAAVRAAGRNTPQAGAVEIRDNELTTREPKPLPRPSAPPGAPPANPAAATAPSSMPPGHDTQPAQGPLVGPAAETWIANAMKVNPGMTREQVIAAGKAKGKL